ncbi:MAG: hypothetical protein ACLU3I_22055 [Acutalibacteraceae bacterium]
MKKTKALSLLLSLLLLLSSLTLPLLAVDAETAADPEQTQTDSADAPAEDDSVGGSAAFLADKLLRRGRRPRFSSTSTRAAPSMSRTRTSACILPA